MTYPFEIRMMDGSAVIVEAESICQAMELAQAQTRKIAAHWNCLDPEWMAEWEHDLAVARRESI